MQSGRYRRRSKASKHIDAFVSLAVSSIKPLRLAHVPRGTNLPTLLMKSFVAHALLNEPADTAENVTSTIGAVRDERCIFSRERVKLHVVVCMCFWMQS